MGNTAANLPPPLVSNNVNGQRQHLQNNNSNQLNYQQEPGVRISTPTKQVSDVCVCCVFLFIYQAPSSVYTHSPSPYPQSYPTKPTIHAPTMSKLQTRENPNSSRFLTSCFLTLARPKARQIKCRVVSTKLAMVINITCILSSLNNPYNLLNRVTHFTSQVTSNNSTPTPKKPLVMQYNSPQPLYSQVCEDQNTMNIINIINIPGECWGGFKSTGGDVV